MQVGNCKRYRAPALAGKTRSIRIGHGMLLTCGAWGRGSNGGKPHFRRVCRMPVPAFMKGVGWACPSAFIEGVRKPTGLGCVPWRKLQSAVAATARIQNFWGRGEGEGRFWTKNVHGRGGVSRRANGRRTMDPFLASSRGVLSAVEAYNPD